VLDGAVARWHEGKPTPHRERVASSPMRSAARTPSTYHALGRPGKIEVVPTKPCATQRDLSLAYTPGVAEPCREIRPRSLARRHLHGAGATSSRSSPTEPRSSAWATLGLMAAKPVMEGKGLLFKRLADIDVFDLELDAEDPDRFIEAVSTLEPTFGAINLEDIKAPECFYIEEELKRRMSIPVFHDDQQRHGQSSPERRSSTRAASPPRRSGS